MAVELVQSALLGPNARHRGHAEPRRESHQHARARARQEGHSQPDLAEAERLLYNGIRAIGYNHSDAQVMRDSMMWAQLRDNNQGIIKITSGGVAPGVLAWRARAAPAPRVAPAL